MPDSSDQADGKGKKAATGSRIDVIADIALAMKSVAMSMSELDALKSRELSFDDYCIIKKIAGSEGANAAQMARAVGASRQRFQQIASDLERRGLISGAASPKNKRAKLFSLTDAGRAVVTEVGSQAQKAALSSKLGMREDRFLALAARSLQKLERDFATSLGLRPAPKKGKGAAAAAADEDEE